MLLEILVTLVLAQDSSEVKSEPVVANPPPVIEMEPTMLDIIQTLNFVPRAANGPKCPAGKIVVVGKELYVYSKKDKGAFKGVTEIFPLSNRDDRFDSLKGADGKTAGACAKRTASKVKDLADSFSSIEATAKVCAVGDGTQMATPITTTTNRELIAKRDGPKVTIALGENIDGQVDHVCAYDAVIPAGAKH